MQRIHTWTMRHRAPRLSLHTPRRFVSTPASSGDRPQAAAALVALSSPNPHYIRAEAKRREKKHTATTRAAMDPLSRKRRPDDTRGAVTKGTPAAATAPKPPSSFVRTTPDAP